MAMVASSPNAPLLASGRVFRGRELPSRVSAARKEMTSCLGGQLVSLLGLAGGPKYGFDMTDLPVGQ